jgi:hypothetical protein
VGDVEHRRFGQDPRCGGIEDEHVASVPVLPGESDSEAIAAEITAASVLDNGYCPHRLVHWD